VARRSGSDNIIPLPGKGRPAPSPKLTRSEQAAWRAIVDSSPERWLDPAAQQLLRRLVVQVGLAERFEQRLRRVAAAGGPIEAEIERRQGDSRAVRRVRYSTGHVRSVGHVEA
jgi:hypothetical protein